MPTLWVLVMAMGPSRKPDSSTQGGASHFAVAIEAEPACVDRIGVLWTTRQDDGDAGADGTFADFQGAIAPNQCRRSDLNSRNIGDGVQRPW